MKKFMSIAFIAVIALMLGISNIYAQQQGTPQPNAQAQAGCPMMGQGGGGHRQCMRMAQGTKCPMANNKCPMQAQSATGTGQADQGTDQPAAKPDAKKQ